MNESNRTALITGANSGLGFEAAAHFAQRGYGRVILATRSEAKGALARDRLRGRTGTDPFELVTVDTTKPDSVRAAVAALVARGNAIDALILNAGILSPPDQARSADGIEMSFAATLTGHHALTLGLLEAGLLKDEARIVISSSEAARGDMPMFDITDVPTFADAHFGGDRVAAIEAFARVEPPVRYRNTPQYAMVKLIAAWWANALARRLPAGMAVYAVSPGAASTNVGNSQGWLMRSVVMPLMAGPIGRALGMSHSAADGARTLRGSDHMGSRAKWPVLDFATR